MKLGLIGRLLGHSYSEKLFDSRFNCEAGYEHYKLFELEDLSKLRTLIEVERLDGLNVTIPYKELVIPFLDQTDCNARIIGAVNTIKIHWKGEETSNVQLVGYNTDWEAFRQSLGEKFPAANGRGRVLILGMGGAAKAIAYAIKTLGMCHDFVSRDLKKGIRYEDLGDIIAKYQIIVNTTPLGMFPNVKSYPPIPYGALNPSQTLYDLVYNPQETEFLKKGRVMGVKTINGKRMLELQAEKSWKIWTS